jgi:SAM-dependent methyltransferase
MFKLNADHLPYNFSDRNTIPGDIRGKQCFILKEDKLVDQARELFGRSEEPLCLKIFLTPFDSPDFDQYHWGKPWRHYSLERCIEIGYISTLIDATYVQNLLWLEGLAPRVYGHVVIEKDGLEYPAQVTEYITGDTPGTASDLQALYMATEEALKKYDCLPCHKDLIALRDFIDGKLVDAQGYRSTPTTKDKITAIITKEAVYGKAVYQSLPALGIGKHPRDTDQRIQEMQLGLVDFGGKVVLDVGCNIGNFCIYASEHGAKRVYGIDTAEITHGAWLVAFYMGQNNIDYITLDLLKDTFPKEVDITFYLSMNVHIGLPEWVLANTKELFIMEENAKGGAYDTQKWIDTISARYNDVKHVGFTTDHNPDQPKPLIFAKDKK